MMLIFASEKLILSCILTCLPKFSEAFDVKELSAIVDFIDFYSWDLQGQWTGHADFSNPIESNSMKTLTLVSVKRSQIHQNFNMNSALLYLNCLASSVKQ